MNEKDGECEYFYAFSKGESSIGLQRWNAGVSPTISGRFAAKLTDPRKPSVDQSRKSLSGVVFVMMTRKSSRLFGPLVSSA